MNNIEFKKIFDSLAKTHGFESVFGGWFMQFAESIVAIDLQKSRYVNSYDLNIKVFVQGMFGIQYMKSKDLIKKSTGDIFIRQPKRFDDVLNLDVLMSENNRKKELEILFNEFLVPFIDKASQKTGLKKLFEDGEIYLLPAVNLELQLLK